MFSRKQYKGDDDHHDDDCYLQEMLVFPYEIALARAAISKRLNLSSTSFFALPIYKRCYFFPRNRKPPSDGL